MWQRVEKNSIMLQSIQPVMTVYADGHRPTVMKNSKPTMAIDDNTESIVYRPTQTAETMDLDFYKSGWVYTNEDIRDLHMQESEVSQINAITHTFGDLLNIQSLVRVAASIDFDGKYKDHVIPWNASVTMANEPDTITGIRPFQMSYAINKFYSVTRHNYMADDVFCVAPFEAKAFFTTEQFNEAQKNQQQNAYNDSAFLMKMYGMNFVFMPASVFETAGCFNNNIDGANHKGYYAYVFARESFVACTLGQAGGDGQNRSLLTFEPLPVSEKYRRGIICRGNFGAMNAFPEHVMRIDFRIQH